MLPIKIICFLCSLIALVAGHGQLIEPPSRASMWRYGYDVPPDYQETECFCGGFDRHYYTNDGNCGICGDPWDAPEPRRHEDGGIFGRGIVVRSYKAGQVINVTVDITAYHGGYFEFKMCPVVDQDGQTKKATQECLNQYPLMLAESGESRYMLPQNDMREGEYHIALKLPQDLQCQRCVLQWHYNCGNRWNWCEDGEGRLGCGDQEVFRGCADVTIL